MKNYFLSSLIKEKVSHYFPGDIGGTGYNGKSDYGDVGGGRSKIWAFWCDVIFEWPLIKMNFFYNTQVLL